MRDVHYPGIRQHKERHPQGRTVKQVRDLRVWSTSQGGSRSEHAPLLLQLKGT